jgi:signal peptidase II
MLYFIISALIVLLDQASKYFMSMHLSADKTAELIPGVIRLAYVENTGAAFSFLRDMRWVLVGVSLVVIVLLVLLLARYGNKFRPVGRLALACVLGGAFGNLIDRALFGYVVDFFEFEFVRFAVFNVADMFITVGGIVFCIHYLFQRDEIVRDFSWKQLRIGKKKKAAAGATGGHTEPSSGEAPSGEASAAEDAAESDSGADPT